MAVYRRPFDHSSHYAARIEWQPQPSWEFDGIAAEIVYIEGTGTFTGGVTLYGIADSVTYTGNHGVISFPITINGVLSSLTYTLNTGTVDADRLNVPTTVIQASLVRNSMTATIDRNSINAQVARNSISARLQ